MSPPVENEPVENQPIEVWEADFNYLAPMKERPYYYTYPPPGGEPMRNTHGDRRRLPVTDARALPETPTLEREGFCLARHQTKVDDLWDADAVRARYYPEMEELVKSSTGARKVVAFDHNVRSEERAARNEDGVQHPVRFVHNDYTETSGPQRVRDLMPADEVDALLSRRFAVVNVWKPIRGPVQKSPLAFCDAQTLQVSDFVSTDLRYRDRVGEIYSVHWQPAHRWFYYSQMEADEALLLACFDSAQGRARYTAHSAVDGPPHAPDAPGRESIEVRTLAFF